jgi:quinol monooxygenase YgiN
MIIRIVRMHFREDSVEKFLTIFNKHKVAIRNVEGCTHLELLKDINHANIFTTLSHWGKPGDLEAYRNSALFKDVWAQVKPLFSESPHAFSLEKFTSK